MTRLEAFKKLFPRETLDDNGYPLNVLPCELEYCPYNDMDCYYSDCKEKFWDVESGFDLVKNDEEVEL